MRQPTLESRPVDRYLVQMAVECFNSDIAVGNLTLVHIENFYETERCSRSTVFERFLGTSTIRDLTRRNASPR